MKTKLLFLLVLFGAFGFKSGTDVPEPVKTDERVLIEMILRRGLLEQDKVPDYNLLRDKRLVCLSRSVIGKFLADSGGITTTDYGRERFPRKVGSVKILALTPQEIQQLANEEGDFLYLELGNIKVEGNYAEIGLSTSWAVSKHTKNKVYMSGGGYLLVYEKINGKWQFKNTLRSWIS
jgi:hypothetical protein